MLRRHFLKSFAGAIVCPICAGLSQRTALASGGAAEWSYEGETGPSNWGDVDVAYEACSAGNQQSPIDLNNAIKADIDTLDVNWRDIALRSIVNNGHTIQVNTPNTGGMELDGAGYDLVQFHFHHMSEHTVEGKRYPLEIHFLHKARQDGGLAVIGTFVEEGDENEVLAPIWAAAPTSEGEAASDATIDATDLLPSSNEIFRYAGSLTTPPCSEIVAWTVFREPVEASSDQIAAFASIFPNNFRPLNPLNRRFILHSN